MKGKQGGHVDAASFNRRDFLVNAGKLAGAALALPLLAKAQGVAAQPAGSSAVNSPAAIKIRERRKIGVLLPQSGVYPQLSANFLAGMNLHFNQTGRQGISLVSSKTGYARGQAWQEAQAMLRGQNIDLMVGMVSPGIASSLHFSLAASKTALIAASLGENLARVDEHSAYIFHHTLGLWQSNWALGKWAATTLGRSAIIASSYYDSGYDTSYAFRMGYEAAGGKVLASYVTHQPAADVGLSALMASIKQNKPDVVFASYYGQAAVDLLNAYARAGLSRSIPLVGTAFLVDQAVIKSVGSAAAGVRTAMSWAANLDTAENQAFVGAYQRNTGKSPDAFALLGYETAHLVLAAVDRQAGSVTDALATASFSGPRGAIAMNASTHTTSGPHYLQQAKQQGINIRNMVLSALPAIGEHDGEVAALRSSLKTGWSSSYLCG
jgi:ABC-type branched-subunit amino acid transport system substrate-binding protein